MHHNFINYHSRAVSVTAIMKETFGTQHVSFVCFFQDTAQATKASTDNNWFAEPNNGQISA